MLRSDTSAPVVVKNESPRKEKDGSNEVFRTCFPFLAILPPVFPHVAGEARIRKPICIGCTPQGSYGNTAF